MTFALARYSMCQHIFSMKKKLSVPSFEHLLNITSANFKSIACNTAQHHEERECGIAIQENISLYPMKKVAMLIAYKGIKYHGYAMNHGDYSLRTVEGQIFDALIESNVITEYYKHNPRLIWYNKASRTDKGVSTCGQVISLRIPFPESLVKLINQHLPDDIRVLGAKKVTKRFNAWQLANSRSYSYTLPTYALVPYRELAGIENYEHIRISDNSLRKLNSVLYRYLGTHTFHNFTTNKAMEDPSSNRFIISCYHCHPFMYKNLQFITIKITGQSFMQHQIRKMVGLAIGLTNEIFDEVNYISSFTEKNYSVPTAPGLGLVLEKVNFDKYDQRQHKKLDPGGVNFTDKLSERNAYLHNEILPFICDQEVKYRLMAHWLEELSQHMS